MAEAQAAQKPLIPWKTRLSITFLSAITDVSRRSNGTVNRRLMDFLDKKNQPQAEPINGVKSCDVTVDTTRNLWFRLFVPTSDSSESLPVVFFFHGGGFAFLSPASFAYDAVCRRFCRKIPAVVVSVNYRLTPEHRYPCQYDDGLDVVKFIDERREVLPEFADVSKCFLAGDSAGANVAHHVAIRACKAGLQNARILGLFSIQPFFGGEERTESEIRLATVPLVSTTRTDWLWKALLPDGSNRDHEAANVSGPNAVDIWGLDYPDTVVIVGGFDPLQDWQRKYYEWLRKSGKSAELIEYPNMIHAFYVFPEFPESSQVISQFKDFVAKHVSNTKRDT